MFFYIESTIHVREIYLISSPNSTGPFWTVLHAKSMSELDPMRNYVDAMLRNASASCALDAPFDLFFFLHIFRAQINEEHGKS